MSAPASSFTQREDNVNQVWPYRIRSIRTTQHIYETTVIKPIPFILFHPDNFAQKKAAYHQTFSLLFTWLQLPTLSWGSCHCDPSPPGKRRTSTAVPRPRCGLPQPPSAAASDLGAWVGAAGTWQMAWEFWKAESLFLPYCSKMFKNVQNRFNIIPFTRWLNHCLSRQLLHAAAMSSTSTPSDTTHQTLTSAYERHPPKRGKQTIQSQAAVHCQV